MHLVSTSSTSTTTSLNVSNSSSFNDNSAIGNPINFSSNTPYVFNETILYPVIEDKTNETIGNCDKLRSWVVKYNVSHNCCNSLLQIMNSEGFKVPKDIRT